ncbi:MAG: DUF1512 family protein [Candidatus Helarchaeota archaeon]
MLDVLFLPSTGTTDPVMSVINLIFQIGFYVFFIAFLFYGTKIQSYTYLRAIQGAVGKLQTLAHEGREIVINLIQKFSIPEIHPRAAVGDLLEFFMVQPVSLDPAGVVWRLERVLDMRQNRFRSHVLNIAPKASRVERENIESTLEAAVSLNLIYRIVRHYYILGKKTNSIMVIMQIQMQLALIMKIANAIMEALKAFSVGKPIGDGIGPLVTASFFHQYKDSNSKIIKDYVEDTDIAEIDIEGRHAYLIRARGPGGTVGKPGEAIKKLLDEHEGKISRLFMVDAGLKLEGEKTGDVIEGVGAVIGGPGVEKFKIEEGGTKYKIPMDGYVIKESEEDAYGPMKKEIADAVPVAIELIKEGIIKRTKEGDSIIICGVGNTIGVGS